MVVFLLQYEFGVLKLFRKVVREFTQRTRRDYAEIREEILQRGAKDFTKHHHYPVYVDGKVLGAERFMRKTAAFFRKG